MSNPADPADLGDYNPEEWPETEPVGDAVIGDQAKNLTPIYTQLGGK